MPIYDYKCGQCGVQLEISHSILDDPKTVCPSCGAPALKRLISKNVGIAFKGSGFYVTDSQSKSDTQKAT